jgi:hypothetical protein
MRQRERMTFKQGSIARGTIATGLSSYPTGVVSPSYAGPETLLDLQRTHGNAFVQRLVQRKLAVSRPGVSYERKADRVGDAVIREKNASSSMPGITRYEQPGVHRMCRECEEEIEHRKVAGKQAVQEEELQAMPRPEMENEVARVNTHSGRSYRPALDEAVLQKQSAQVRLSTRSVGATPAIISCQETSPEETSGKQRGAGSKPRDIKKLLKDPCFGERVDDTKRNVSFPANSQSRLDSLRKALYALVPEQSRQST